MEIVGFSCAATGPTTSAHAVNRLTTILRMISPSIRSHSAVTGHWSRFGLDPALLHHLVPALVILADTRIELLRRAAACNHAVCFEDLFHRRVPKRLVDGGVEPVDDR